MKRKFKILMVFCMLAIGLCAQEKQRFSPEKFEADMVAYITREAQLSQQECEGFFPLLKEMHNKQRELYGKIRKIGKERPADDKAFAEAVKEVDRMNIELKQIEEQYHQNMLKKIPASKLYDAIKAENRFHRQMMKGWQHPQNPKNKVKKPTDRLR